MEVIALRPLRTRANEWEVLEKKLKLFFAKHIYLDLFKIIESPRKLKNAKYSRPLISSLSQGKIHYESGSFSGQFSAGTSLALKKLGARFNSKTSRFEIPLTSLPLEVRNAIAASEKQFNATIQKIDEHLSKINPQRLAGKFESAQFFDKKLWTTDQEFKENIKNITVAPKLSDVQRKAIAAEWSNNMKLWIKDFTETEIKELRSQIFDSNFSGNRWESLTDTIKKSYGVSERKAKFLARQETHLLLSQFKQAQYTGAGVHEYIWRCVHRPHDISPKHHTPGNVRYSHGLLNGKVFRWDSPPITSNPGEPQRRNNPGQDYNCIPEDEQVSLHSPAIKAFRRWYTGELTEIITDSNKSLRCTPNHPVLTLRGWISAHLIQMDDYLVEAPSQSFETIVGNPQSGNATASKIFSALSQKGFHHRIPGTAARFHGDVSSEDIDVITTDRMLLSNDVSFTYQKFGDNILTRTDSLRFGSSPQPSGFIGMDHSSDSIMGSIREFRSFDRGSLRHSQIHGSGSATKLNMISNQHSSNRPSITFEFFSDSLLAHAFLVQPDYFTFRKVNKIVRSPFWSGYVHNFETLTGWYSSNNLIVHNCRCYARPIIRS